MKIRNCQACKNQPEARTAGDMFVISCKECGTSVADAVTENAVINWNLCQMSAREIAEYGISLMSETIETLQGVTERLRAEIADNNNSPEK